MESNSNSSAMDRLQQMVGLENIKEQFKRYRNAFKRHRESKAPGVFRPHMAFMGNPGTGKSTVARLFAEILHEDGLLPQGYFVEATVGDLIGQYIGETRVKAGAICDRVKGGVLFIDEAYGLMSGTNEHGNADFGQEAIEVLIQFMMNNDDTVVIFAGYSDEIEKFMDETFIKTHFLSDLSIYYFEDYEPDVLYNIARQNIPKSIETTDAFDKALKNIIILKHAYRTKVFGNARDMENIANTIVSAYYDTDQDGPLDVVHLPERLRILVDPSVFDENIMLAELNQKIVGQQQIKHFIRDLYLRLLAERTKMSIIKGYKPELLPLNFIFAGNPGTGKSTVARIIGNLLQKMGVLSSNDNSVFTEISGSEVANMTPNHIMELFEDNIGKVLFIDEAYMLAGNPRAITEIISNVTKSDYRGKLCLILAGYATEMHQMMRLYLGMSSRFEKILFEDYTNEELWEILKRKINVPNSKYIIDDVTCKKTAINYFASLPRSPHFDNASIITGKLLPLLKSNHTKRYIEATDEQKADPDFAMRILPEDFPNKEYNDEESNPQQQKAPLSAMDRLKRLFDMDGTQKQLERYLIKYRYHKDKNIAFYPHMAFLGSPESDMMTIGELFSEILYEEGLIAYQIFVALRGQYLINSYVGHSAIKARALFDRAKGGVLFIENAYELFTENQSPDISQYGKEIIMELIQFMEDERDTIVILAGYTDKIRYMLQHGNPGFARRVTNEFIMGGNPDIPYDMMLSSIYNSENGPMCMI